MGGLLNGSGHVVSDPSDRNVHVVDALLGDNIRLGGVPDGNIRMGGLLDVVDALLRGIVRIGELPDGSVRERCSVLGFELQQPFEFLRTAAWNSALSFCSSSSSSKFRRIIPSERCAGSRW